jgi:hypothetical protein
LILHTKYCVFLQVFLLACIGFGGEWNRDGSEGCFSQVTPPEVQESPWRYELQELLGWKLHIRRELIENQAEAAKLKLALEILQKQLEQIVRVVPGDCVAKLQGVELWFSPVYPDEQPRAEYHPGAGWLKEHRRDPAMAKGVEFSNVGIFEAEFRRMPNFALHELAHAYHDQCLQAGFSNPEIQEAFERAKKSGSYERIEQRLGDGSARQTRAYAMSNPAEYFSRSRASSSRSTIQRWIDCSKSSGNESKRSLNPKSRTWSFLPTELGRNWALRDYGLIFGGC